MSLTYSRVVTLGRAGTRMAIARSDKDEIEIVFELEGDGPYPTFQHKVSARRSEIEALAEMFTGPAEEIARRG